MTTYRQVKGYSIKSVSTDPSNIKEGQIWYNNTSKSIKVSPKISGFSSGGSLPAARQNSAGFGTSQAAGALAGGNAPGSYNNTETFEYDGSSWTDGGDLNTGRRGADGTGTQTAGLVHGGRVTTSYITDTEEYDGSSWSEQNNLNTGRQKGYSGGTQTAAVFAGGSASDYVAKTEEYNGTSWSEVTDMPQSYGGGTANSESQTDMLACGGGPGTQTTVLAYDGTNWTSSPSLSGSGRRGNRGAIPSSNLGFTAGGETATTNPVTTVEEYNGVAWSAGTAIPSATRDAAGAGTAENGLFMGGYTTAITTNVLEYVNVATTRSVDVS